EEERDRFFTTSLDMLGIVGMDGYFKRLNPAFSAILGYSEAELLSRPFMELIHPDDREATQRLATQLEQGGNLMGFENRYLRQDGTWCWLEWKTVSFPEERLIYVAARDITERKATEVSLYQTNEELERRVDERTRELAVANGALQVENVEHRTTTASLMQMAEAYRKSQETAEAASRAKSEFMSHMSHELRTPLNAILGFGQILQSANLEDEEKEQVKQILNGGWHLLDLIDEILDISRVEAGKLDLVLEVVPLVEVLSESCALVGPLAAQRGITINSEGFQKQEIYVVADRQRIKQVLINLISNGIKYNRENGSVFFALEPNSDGRVRLGVRDTGQGLSSEDLAKLFVPFERLGASKAGIDGTGLGLVLSKHLLSSMDGGLEVESTEGVGSTFWLELPTSSHASPTIALSDVTAFPTWSLQRAPHSYRVLSIEDDSSNQRLVQQLLSSRTEIDFRGAPTGQVGLRLAFELQPHLILMNLNLPDMTGTEVLQQLRRNETTRKTPVIVVSADARHANIEMILAQGATDYLTKPYTMAQMMAVINKALTSTLPSQLLEEEDTLNDDGMPRSLRILVAEDNSVNQKIIAHQLKKMGHAVDVCTDGHAAVGAWQSGQYDLILM
ncbi:response regulator, partial [bacterium]